MAEVITLARFKCKEISETKICANCGDVKLLDDMQRKEGNADGRGNICKKCESNRQMEVRNKRLRRNELVIGYEERMPFDWAYEN